MRRPVSRWRSWLGQLKDEKLQVISLNSDYLFFFIPALSPYTWKMFLSTPVSPISQLLSAVHVFSPGHSVQEDQGGGLGQDDTFWGIEGTF